MAKCNKLAVKAITVPQPMNKQRPLLLLLLVVYIFSPRLLDWVIDAREGWYRPFILWGLLVLIAYFLQKRDTSNDI